MQMSSCQHPAETAAVVRNSSVTSWTSSVADTAFGVHVGRTLNLKRITEYCQWTETSSEHCDTCRSTSNAGSVHPLLGAVLLVFAPCFRY